MTKTVIKKYKKQLEDIFEGKKISAVKISCWYYEKFGKCADLVSFSVDGVTYVTEDAPYGMCFWVGFTKYLIETEKLTLEEELQEATSRG